MGTIRGAAWIVAAAIAGTAVAAWSQGRPDPAVRITAQREAMARLAFLDGEWRGPTWTLLETGEKHTLTQTERVGPFLDGSIRVMEGRGYEADGAVVFNAFGVVSYDPDRKVYNMRSYAQGYLGDFVVTVTATGFSWEMAAGPMTMRYTATIDGDTWREVGDRITPGQPPVRFLEMNLTKVGATEWPAGDPVNPK